MSDCLFESVKWEKRAEFLITVSVEWCTIFGGSFNKNKKFCLAHFKIMGENNRGGRPSPAAYLGGRFLKCLTIFATCSTITPTPAIIEIAFAITSSISLLLNDAPFLEAFKPNMTRQIRNKGLLQDNWEKHYWFLNKNTSAKILPIFPLWSDHSDKAI